MTKFFLTFWFIFVLLLSGGRIMSIKKAGADKTCADLLYGSGCTPDDCYQKCVDHGGIGHIGVCLPKKDSDDSYCLCLYSC
ncbi:unnamed protein product [Linum trigynum]|uniref:Uncharacterized protein n=1 Tax=Linum trigynum TaxID=586398 RepID=A0AAV2CDE0_9ROSI